MKSMETQDTVIVEFAMTCPQLLSKEHRSDPYKVLEQLFSYCGLGGYRAELNKWFKHALSEGVKYKRASDLLFIHDQFEQFIQAAYLIASKGIRYTPTPDPNGMPFSEWLVQNSCTKDTDNIEHHAYTMPYWLEVRHRNAPIEYLQQILTIENVKYIRTGLQEWKEASSSKHMCIADLEHKYLFDLYILVQKIVEACYLLITADVKLNRK
jgi:hypothetical protein